MKNKVILVFVLAMLYVVAIVGVTDVVATQKPQPPFIQEFGIPNPVGYTPDCGIEPAGGATSCGVICYYVTEDAVENQHELSCIPAWFD